jgi:hypothetical protein
VPRLRGPAPHRAPRPLTAAIVVLLVAGALGAAGVGTGDGDGPIAAGDAAATPGPDAGRLVFQRDDFPDGWERSERDGGAPGTGAAPAVTPGGGGATAQFCPALGGDPTSGRLTSEAESFFTNASPGTFSFAGSFVGVADDAAVAPAGFQFLAGEAFLRCAADGFAKGFLEGGAAGVTLTEEASEPIPVVPGAGQAQGRRLTYTARGPAFELPLYVDLAVVHAGASVGLAYLGAYREPLPADLEQRLLDSLLSRMAATG